MRRSLAALAPRRVATGLLVVLAATFVRAEAPDVKALVPAGVQRGASAEVRVVGKLGSRPASVWTSSDTLSVTVPETGDSFTVTATDDTPLGLHWLRVHNAEGASKPRPFLVGSLPEVAEQETNDSVERAQEIDAAGAVVNGVLAKSGDVDGYAVELRKGDTLVAAVEANFDLGSPMDAVLQIADDRGFVLDQNDDTRGNDPRLVFPCPADGRYVVRLFAFPSTPNSTIRFAGGDDYVYRLTLATGPYADHVVPLAVRPGEVTLRTVGSNTVSESWSLTAASESRSITTYGEGPVDPVPLSVTDHPSFVEGDVPAMVDLPATITGHVDEPEQVDEYAFRATKGTPVVATLEAASLGFPLDAALDVVDEAGKSLKTADDGKGSDYDPELEFSPPADGTYRLRVRDVYERGGPRFAYRLTIGPRDPSFTLELAADRFTVAAGKSVKVAVTIGRDRGFEEAIEIAVEGLPEGVTAAIVKSEPKGDTKGKVEIEITAAGDAEAASGPIRIVGRSGREHTATAAVEGTRARTDHIWLTLKP